MAHNEAKRITDLDLSRKFKRICMCRCNKMNADGFPDCKRCVNHLDSDMTHAQFCDEVMRYAIDEIHENPDKPEECYPIVVPKVDKTDKRPGKSGIRRVLTYGTFDMLHYGHIRLLKRAKSLGDHLTVGLSSPVFQKAKGKTDTYYTYEQRKEMLEALRYVDLVIPEDSFEEHADHVRMYQIDILVMGSDWAGDERFEALRGVDGLEVVYLPRTMSISTSGIKSDLDKSKVVRLKHAPHPIVE